MEGFRHRLPMISLVMAAHESRRIHLRVSNQGFTQFPIKLWTENEFHENRAFELMLTSSLLFAIAMMLIYNLLLYVTTRERILGLYIVFILMSVCGQISPTGLIRLGDFGELGIFLSNSGYILIMNLCFALIWPICMSFLEIPADRGKLRFVAFAGIGVSVISMLALGVSYSLSARLSTFHTYINLTALCAVTLASVWHGNRSAKYLLLAWSGMIACIALQQLYWIAVVTNQSLAFGGLIGTSTEVVLISLAIGHKMRSQIQFALNENKRVNQEILEKEKARTIFFQNTSHELRTPLNGMIGFLHLVIEGTYGQLNEGMKLQLTKTLSLAESLKNQVNTILDLARLKRGHRQLESSSISLREFKRALDDLCEGLRLRHPHSNYQSELQVQPDSEHIVQDYHKLFTICRNLLGNAFKFSQGDRINSVRLQIRCDQGKLVMRVSDSGLGIPKDQIDRIFEEFAQVESDARRSHEGTGLGLTMARDFAQLMGGTIHVESELGRGSTFTVTLPRQALTQNEALPTPPAMDPVSPEAANLGRTVDLADPRSDAMEKMEIQSGASILVVDDNAINCEVIHDLLATQGYQPKTALGGRMALELLQKESFDLILLDIMMPEVSGEDVLQSVRQDPHLKDIPVVLITARASEEDRIHGFNLGADDYISKPIIPEELILRVGNLLRRVAETRRKSLEEGEEKLRQVGELFAHTSHEIKNVYNFIDENSRISLEEFVSMVGHISLPMESIQAMAKALFADETASSLQASMDALPKVSRDEPILRSIRTNLASLQMSTALLPGVWAHIVALPPEEAAYLNTVLKWAFDSMQLYKTVLRSRDIFYATLEFVRVNEDAQCQLWSSLDPIMVLMTIRAKKESIRLESNIPRLILQADSSAVQQIVVNLLTNAMDAVLALPVAERKVKIWVDPGSNPGTLHIKVGNAGAPIPESNRSQLFKRGFTTKGSKGNGIGLYLSRKLARKNRGDIFLDTASRETCFVLELQSGESQAEVLNALKLAG
jgi:signal transduction histidine kinase